MAVALLSNHGTKNAIWQPLTTTAVGTNFSTYLPAEGFFRTDGFNQVTLFSKRTADTGSCTFQPFIEFFDPAQNGFESLLDLTSSGAAVSGVLVANDTANEELLILQNMPVYADADGTVTINTIHKIYQVWIPPFIRVRFDHAGTTVSNTFSATLFGT